MRENSALTFTLKLRSWAVLSSRGRPQTRAVSAGERDAAAGVGGRWQDEGGIEEEGRSVLRLAVARSPGEERRRGWKYFA